jgi:pimeloyl-ACP methyl ester carboxylesterase
MYSGQAYGIFHGDLDFYFGGFDARDRVASIDVKKCPIYFLTGEYDWSTTPEMSQATAKKISGANFQSMKGLGHFPATEDPQKFVSLYEALRYPFTIVFNTLIDTSVLAYRCRTLSTRSSGFRRRGNLDRFRKENLASQPVIQRVARTLYTQCTSCL